jgi:biofilm PGA synthesis N-glycosyltransferase PgaC
LSTNGGLKLAAVVCFLNEAEYLPKLLASIDLQTQRPEQLLLIDDGSRDGSYEITSAFADQHSWARVLRRPVRPPSDDRLVTGHLNAVVLAFQWGVENITEPWDIILKLDGDLQLNPELFEEVRRRFVANPTLGITGSRLSIRQPSGRLVQERNPQRHVRGPNKFYRRACYEQISPLPPILGWDTIDELRARLHDWTAESFFLASGESIHLRPTSSYDGRLRGSRRQGLCAWSYGSHPLRVVLAGVYRMRDRPYVLSGLSYILGWALAGLRRYPRAEPAVIALSRKEEFAEIRQRLSSFFFGRYKHDTRSVEPSFTRPKD